MNQNYLKEFVKSRENPVYFMSKYIKVTHPVRGLVPFALYPFQQEIVKQLDENRFNVLRKFRQAGCTTIAGAYSLHFTNFNKHKTVVILSKGDTESTEVLDRIKIMHDELPGWLKQPIIESNKHTLKFKNGSVIKSRPSGKQSGRSLAGSLLIIDEAAFIEAIDSIWAAVYPIISTGGRAFVLSTVNGMGNWYHKIYSEALRQENAFNVIDIEWKNHPEYKKQKGYEKLYEELDGKGIDVDKWEHTTKLNMPFKQWLQEYECEFLGTGETYLEGSILKRLVEEVEEDFEIKYNNRMRVFKQPDPTRQYVMGVDTSLGRERDYSAFQILDCYTGEQVAEFYSNRTPINEFAEIIDREATLYGTALVMPERNTIGENLIDWLFNVYEYENLWMEEGTDRIGYLTTAKSKEFILAKMEEYIRKHVIKINSKRTVEELLTFIIDNNNKIKADRGKNDDLIMSLAFATFALHTLSENDTLEYSQIPHKTVNPLVPDVWKRRVATPGGITEEDMRWVLAKTKE
jgi:hypothetical protein